MNVDEFKTWWLETTPVDTQNEFDYNKYEKQFLAEFVDTVVDGPGPKQIAKAILNLTLPNNSTLQYRSGSSIDLKIGERYRLVYIGGKLRMYVQSYTSIPKDETQNFITFRGCPYLYIKDDDKRDEYYKHLQEGGCITAIEMLLDMVSEDMEVQNGS